MKITPIFQHCALEVNVFQTSLSIAFNLYFLLSGDAMLHYKLNSSGSDGRLHLFVSEDWKDASGDEDCHRRLAKARETG